MAWICETAHFRPYRETPLLWTASQQDRANCNLETSLGLNESFSFYNFPGAHPPWRSHSHAIGVTYFAPEECTLTFNARDGCVLEFVSHYYERGDVDCNEQYLLIGDEFTEERYAHIPPMPPTDKLKLRV